VEEANNGREALQKIFKDKPDIILLDGMMPDMDGFQTYERLKENPQMQDIPIIFCSATHIKELKERGLKVDEYLEKPYQIEELYQKIKKIIKIKNLLPNSD
jgi:two-component system sensor histidine kinase/response regulator